MPVHPRCLQAVALGCAGLAGAGCAALGWSGLNGEAVCAALGWTGLTGAAGCPFAGLGLIKAAAPRVFAEPGLVEAAASAALARSGLVGAGCAARGWAGLIGVAGWMFAVRGSLGALGLRASPSVLGLSSVIVPPGPESPGMYAGTHEQSNVVNVCVSLVRNLERSSHPPVRACAAVVRSNRPRRSVDSMPRLPNRYLFAGWLGPSSLYHAASSLEVSQETRRAAAADSGVRRTQGRPPRAFGRCAGCRVGLVATASGRPGIPTDPSRRWWLR